MCRARVHTIGEEITKVLNVHSHPPDPAKISGKQIFSKLKQLSMDVGSSTHAVIAKVYQDITPGVSSVLPSISSLKRNVRRYRIFSLDTRQIAALAFIPEEAMENEFKTLCESKFYENNEPELTPILNYFEDT
ncbi:hypothetical protein QTP88_013243 [Uroleucon formosanum]